MLLIFLSIVLLVVAYSTLFSFYPLKTYKPVFIVNDDQATKYPTLKAIGNVHNPVENPQPVVQKYLLKKFVEAYETYDFRNNFARLERNKKVITQLSDEDTARQYDNFMNVTNPDSPMLRYHKEALRKVEVDKGSFSIQKISGTAGQSADSSQRYTATVDFSATETSITTGVQQKNTWRAKISFVYKDIRYDRKTRDFMPLKFKITKYSVEKLG